MPKTTKVCTKCGEEKGLEEYCKDKRFKDGLRSHCKACIREYRQENKERIKEQKKQHYQENKDRIKSRQKHYRQENKERINKYSKQHYQENKDRYLECHKQYAKKRYSVDPIFRYSSLIRTCVRKAFHQINMPKSGPTFELLGYTPEQLCNHLSTYLDKLCQDCGAQVVTLDHFHIDHIIPISTAKTEEDVIRLNQLNNLRLICPECNMKKGAKLLCDVPMAA